MLNYWQSAIYRKGVMDLGDAAKERAGEIGTDMAEAMLSKIREAIGGFPGSAEQRIAIADLVAEGSEQYANDLRG